jgi:two-component system chemotaxis response regulator CheV
MAGVLETVNQRTQMVGQNRLELLLFKLEGKQTYGINVFKVREVIRSLNLTKIPKSNPVVCGIANIRGLTVPVIDLNMAVGGDPVPDPSKCFIIITEYNRAVQGFLVNSVVKIINMHWEAIHEPPPGTAGRTGSYLTAVTQVEKELIEIIDVEKVLSEISPQSTDLSKLIPKEDILTLAPSRTVLIVDDSMVARSQMRSCLEQLNLKVIERRNGVEALKYLNELSEKGDITQQLLMLISDVEMPEMDGYTLCTEVRANPVLKGLYVILHTSLSGVFNNALVEKVGANRFVAKFQAEALFKAVQDRLELLKVKADV